MFKVLHFSPSVSAGVPVSDPFAEVRVLKKWARLGVYTIIIVFGAVDYFVLDLTWVQMIYVRIASLTVATLAIELIFHQSLKLRKRSAYPARVLVEAGASESVAEAADAVLTSFRRLLGIRAGALVIAEPEESVLLSVCGWEEATGREVWAQLAPRLGEHAETQTAGSISPPPDLVATAVCRKDEVIVLVPLITFNRCIGALIAVGPRNSADLADMDLLRGMGNAIGVALDSLRQKEEIQAKEDRLRTVINAAPVVLFRLDPSGVFTMIEGKALERLQIRPDQVLGRSVYDVLPDVPEFADGFRRALAGETVRAVAALGDVTFEAELCPISDAAGEVTNVIGVATDVTERRRAEDMIRHMAFHDSLTGLPNRELFERRLTEGLAEARHNGSLLSVLFLDLDGFKEANDTVGHSEGDRLLKEVAGALTRLVREDDFVARIGGDEFLVLLPGISGTQEAVAVSDRILNGLNVSWLCGDQSRRLTASIGVAVFPTDGEDGDALLRSADRAMYEAKRRGKSRYALVAGLVN
jgi:diguanylate cyclase (GGDEF)-like protein/PAS domain S-box-containing protein